MGSRLRFLWSLLKHKWYVIKAGRLTGVPLWRLVLHDWTKYTPVEFRRYARYFHGDYSESPKAREADAAEFALAWLHHENSNPHHHGYWIPRTGAHANEPLPMPEVYVREMVADWLGAGKTYTGSWDIAMWLNENGPKMRLHDDTKTHINGVMHEIGYFLTDNCDWSWMAGSSFRKWAGE